MFSPFQQPFERVYVSEEIIILFMIARLGITIDLDSQEAIFFQKSSSVDSYQKPRSGIPFCLFFLVIMEWLSWCTDWITKEKTGDILKNISLFQHIE